jgi:hypothetical protein
MGALCRGASLALALMVLAAPLPAADEYVPPPRPTVSIPRLESPPELEHFLDMRPEGAVAESMTRITGLIQRDPEDGEPVSQHTEIYLGYDQENIYAVFVAFDDDPSEIRANMTRRESFFGDDIVEIMLDTFNDERRAYAFICNPFGIQNDGLWTEGQGFDFSFDTVWQSRGQITDRGFVVWMAIPFKSLRFSDAPEQTWGLILVRDIQRNNESSFWPRVSNRVSGRLQQEATMTGLRDISPSKNQQYIPYITGRRFRFLDDDPEDPRFVKDDADVEVGVDAKFVFKDALVFDVTLNPDFSQVEADQPQVTVNQRFEVFFPETRPFFLENANYFETRINLLFTRRILDPQVGTRLTGKLGKNAIGALLINDEAPGELAPPDSPFHDKNAGIGVFRLDRDVLEQSTVGVMFTDYELADSYNRVASVDGRFRINDTWTTEFQGVVSRTRDQGGSGESGTAFTFQFDRNHRVFSTHIDYQQVSPDFFTRLGFVPRRDYREFHQQVSYRLWPEGKHLISWGPSLYYQWIEDFDGLRLDWRVNPSLQWSFRRQTDFRVFYAEGAERLRPQDFPGLTEDIDFDRSEYGFIFGTRFINAFNMGLDVEKGEVVNFVPPDGELPTQADATIFNVDFTVRPTRRLRGDLLYLFNRLDESAGGERIFDNEIARMRWTYQFTPRITLRLILENQKIDANPARTRLEDSEDLFGDVLLTYLVNPWTAAYVGYTEQYADQILFRGPGGPIITPTPGNLNLDARQFFVKFSYLFRR